MKIGSQRRNSGDIALVIVMQELICAGFDLFIPFTNNPDVDVVAKFGMQVFTIQVKGRTPNKRGRLQIQHKIKCWTNSKKLMKEEIEPTYDVLAVVNLLDLRTAYYQRREFMKVKILDICPDDGVYALVSHGVSTLL